MNTSVDLSVVVPCFNEGAGLLRLRSALRHALEEVQGEYEIILVDDGSTDGTVRLARRISNADPRFHYVSLSRNFGKEAALLAGIRHATGRRIALMDADLQHPPELLGDMLELLEAGYDQVIARRTRDGDSAIRTMLARLYYAIANRFVEVRLEDGVGDFRVLSRRAADALLSIDERTRFSKGIFAWIGFDTATVPYGNVERQQGGSKWSLGALLDYGMDGVLSFNRKPLRAALYLGAAVALFSLGYSAFSILGTVFRLQTPGYGLLIAGIAGIAGTQMVFLGVIGEYVGRIYVETKGRPHYLVKETSLPSERVREPVTPAEPAREERVLPVTVDRVRQVRPA